jgi:ferredoxin
VGDHGCEYMTGGTVAVLGLTGRNFAAGMSGGIAYVLDVDGDFEKRCNPAMVDLEPVLAEAEQQAKVARELWHLGQSDEALLRSSHRESCEAHGSRRAQQILADWAASRTRFVKVFPKEYRRALSELAAAHKKGGCLMGKVTGFLEFARVDETYEAVEARKKHYREFIPRLTNEQAGVQGARCMDCGIPFCMTGCPVNNIIPDFNDLVFRQDWKSAIETLHSTNNFPGVHRADLPGALRGILRAAHQQRRRRHQVDRARDHRSCVGGRLGRAQALPRTSRGRRWRSSVPARRAWPAHSSSRAPATRSCSSRRTTASADCCAMAFRISSWRNGSSIGGSSRWPPRASISGPTT